MYQELISEDDNFDVKSDERLYLDLRASSGHMKEAEKLFENLISHSSERSSDKKIKIKSRGSHSSGEYLYILSKNGLTLRRRTYTINQTDDDLLE